MCIYHIHVKTIVTFKIVDVPTNAEEQIKSDNTLNTEYVNGFEGESSAEFEAIDIGGIITDVQDSLQEIAKEFMRFQIQNERYQEHILPVDIFVSAEVFGMSFHHQITVDEERFNYEKTGEEPEPVMNKLSLQHDIQYLIPLIQTAENDTNLEPLRWVHHILNKHFQIPMPPEYVPQTAEEKFEETRREEP